MSSIATTFPPFLHTCTLGSSTKVPTTLSPQHHEHYRISLTSNDFRRLARSLPLFAHLRCLLALLSRALLSARHARFAFSFARYSLALPLLARLCLASACLACSPASRLPRSSRYHLASYPRYSIPATRYLILPDSRDLSFPNPSIPPTSLTRRPPPLFIHQVCPH